MRSGVVLASVIGVWMGIGCTAPDGDVPPWAPVAGISGVQLGDEQVTYAALLGRPRWAIEAGLPQSQPSELPGWHRYGNNLYVEYDDDGRAVRLRARVPLGLNCDEAARWMGFPWPRQAVVRSGRCMWPGAHIRHRLAKGYGGEFDPSMRWFRVWMVGAADDARLQASVTRR